jgi:dTDP-4-amino-4,6-dideoxygalactose transaminase
VFCDIDPDTYCVTAETVRAALTPRTKAVVVVHLFGNVAPVAEIEALGVPVLEDAAQALGSDSAAGRAGALGRAATFSFYPSKNLGCFGDGGMIVSSDAQIAEQARILRFHGSRDKVDYEQLGYNSRLDELQAAIMRVQLPHLESWAEGRREAGRHYERAGLGELVALPVPVAGSDPAWHLFVIGHPEPARLERALEAAGIGCKVYYRTPVHRQAPMAKWGAGLELPGTEQAAARHLAIPMSPVLSRAQADEVVAAIGQADGAA